MIPHLSRIGVLLWSAFMVVVIVESQTLAAMMGVQLSLIGVFGVWVAVVVVLILLHVWPRGADTPGGQPE